MSIMLHCKAFQHAVVLLLLQLISSNAATHSFIYNDDVLCGYPFEDFKIESITCSDSNSYSVSGNGGDNYQNNDGVCYFGQNMDIEGSVTLQEDVYRYFTVKLKVCFQDARDVWYGYNHCSTYSKALDFLKFSSNVQDESNPDQEEDNNYNYYYETNYLQAGEHKFTMNLKVPTKSFTFNEGKRLFLTFLHLHVIRNSFVCCYICLTNLSYLLCQINIL